MDRVKARALGVKPLYPERVAAPRVVARPGAGGVAGVGSGGSRSTDDHNAREVICGRERLGDPAFEAALVPTADPADRAHLCRAGSVLLPAHVFVRGGRAVENRVLAARPRRYPAHQVNGVGLAVDSQFDDLHQRQIRLEGLALGIGRTDPDGLRPWEREASEFVEQRFAAIVAKGADGFRTWERAGQVHRFRSTLDVKATKILSKAGYRADGSEKGGGDAGDED